MGEEWRCSSNTAYNRQGMETRQQAQQTVWLGLMSEIEYGEHNGPSLVQ